MKVTVYLEYIDYYNNSSDANSYYENYDYINELNKLNDGIDDVYNKMESFSNGEIGSLRGDNRLNDNYIINNKIIQENSLKQPISLCQCDGFITSSNDTDVIKEMAYCASCSSLFRCSIALDFDTSDEDFEDELNNWGYEPKVLKLKFKNNMNSYSYAELKECYLMVRNNNVIDIAAKNLNFIKDIN